MGFYGWLITVNVESKKNSHFVCGGKSSLENFDACLARVL